MKNGLVLSKFKYGHYYYINVYAIKQEQNQLFERYNANN